MRRTTASLPAILLAAAGLAWLPAAPVAQAAPPPSSAAVIVSDGSTDAKVGDTLSLTGTQKGEALDVTVTKVVNPARAEDAYLTPSAGDHLVAVQFRLKNTGTALYNDSPSNGAAVVDKDGQRFDASLDPTAAGVEFPGSVTIRPGGKALGYVTFEVPNGSAVTAVQFSMDSGFSDDVGEWAVP